MAGKLSLLPLGLGGSSGACSGDVGRELEFVLGGSGATFYYCHLLLYLTMTVFDLIFLIIPKKKKKVLPSLKGIMVHFYLEPLKLKLFFL